MDKDTGWWGKWLAIYGAKVQILSHVFGVTHHTWHDISHPDYYKKSRTSHNNMLYTLLNMLHTFSQEVLVLRRGKTDTPGVVVTHSYVINPSNPHTQQNVHCGGLGCLKYKLRKQAQPGQTEQQSVHSLAINRNQHIPQSLGEHWSLVVERSWRSTLLDW